MDRIESKERVMIFTVPPEDARIRLDVWLSRQHPDWSRARVQQWIRDGHVLLNGHPRKVRHEVAAADRVEVSPPLPTPSPLVAQPIPLDILFEDPDLLVINKPAGLVVHPAAGHEQGTLVNALLYHCDDLAGIGGTLRPGIVHRLDKDTSGVLVIAKNERALNQLAAQFKDRTTDKTYTALVRGMPEPPVGEITVPIGRNPHHRKKMAAGVSGGRSAHTTYRTVESYGEASLLRIQIKTGRTHQIRVHLTHIGHPILGDTEYGRARTLRDGTPVPRQMLHATILALQHPVHGERLEFEAPLPDDLRALIQHLRANG